ncbi:phospholipase A and acyltransferase 4-like [Cheilinus undulatus]|uniref:phospholipase A and acyltransferase 4-like n=1 Tax=Cheilinus undulatus TaxID=241271 RepID=UPI001BD2BFBA|nr:phospholipase A and acyltransferase 4-like [Cheilinus undulatus]
MAPTLFDHGAKHGDLIEIIRDTYRHWAVYIGGNEVVHLIPSVDDSGPFGGFLELIDSSTAQVRRQKIWEVVKHHRFRVNNLLDDEHEPRDPHDIVKDACRMVGQEVPYSVTSHNCEHFVTELRYGKAESRQVKIAAAIGGAAVVGVGLVALGAMIGSLLKGDDKRERRHHK